jgi:thiol-disulfide isomerase/thioredoxin
MVELAESAPSDPVARDALLWVLNKPGRGDEGAYGDEFARAAALLVRHHGDDPEAVRIGLRLDLSLSPRRDALLLGLYAAAKGREAKGLARLALAQYLAHKAEEVVYARSVEGRPRMRILRGGKVVRELDLSDERYAYHLALRQCDPQVIRAEAVRLFEEVISEYGEVPLITTRQRVLEALLKEPVPRWNGQPLTDDGRLRIEAVVARKKTLCQEAEARLDEMFNLALGKPAPEIEGVDVDGKPLKLSDSQGRVVVLVFWGSWCGPCMQQVPHERELAERYKDRPFNLLGVNCRDTGELARKTIEREKITWPNWYDGVEAGGPITTLYRVRGFPSMFVIDGKGIIRSREQVGPAFDALVEGLVKEAEATRRPGGPQSPG